MPIFEKLKSTILSLNTDDLPEERKQKLQPLVDFVQQKLDEEKKIRIIFICTHNSRRSHFAQAWAQALVYFFSLERISCYSGGTETTKLFPAVIESLESVGFEIEKLSEEENPVYQIEFAENEHPVIGFSKRWNHDFNPESNFAAVMTCAEADEACPLIPGAEKRIQIPYEDPKIADGHKEQDQKYMETNLQIATELFYIFSKIKK